MTYFLSLGHLLQFPPTTHRLGTKPPNPVSSINNYSLHRSQGGKENASPDHSPLLLGTDGGNVEIKDADRHLQKQLLFSQNIWWPEASPQR